MPFIAEDIIIGCICVLKWSQDLGNRALKFLKHLNYNQYKWQSHLAKGAKQKPSVCRSTPVPLHDFCHIQPGIDFIVFLYVHSLLLTPINLAQSEAILSVKSCI